MPTFHPHLPQRAALSAVLAIASIQLLSNTRAELLAGAASVDITPPAEMLPVIQNGGFLEARAASVVDPLHARCLAFADGDERLAICIVDSCMVPLDVCDRAKALAAERCGIARDRVLVAATHTHSAPSVMGFCLGTRADPAYTAMLPGKIAEAVAAAFDRLAPAQIGWARADAGDFTHCRRWVRHPDKLLDDPFGEPTVRANMHPGHGSPDTTGPSGPADPWLSLLSVQHADGRPLALLANFSMHYFSGHPGLSADYFGAYADAMAGRLAPDDAAFVAAMSQGTSGDLWRGDYSQPSRKEQSMAEYAAAMADITTAALADTEHRREGGLAMAERRFTLGRRTPDPARLAWARAVLDKMEAEGARPRNKPEVYAEQAVYLHENPSEEIVVQGLRLGGVGIAAMPNEVYALTGLKVRALSPLERSFTIELANGASGYIPPPEQHALGGYNTWPARTAGLEVEAEPKILDAAIELLEEASGQPRRRYAEPAGAYAEAVLADKPLAYWRMGAQSGAAVEDAAGGGRGAELRGGYGLHLPGAEGRGFGAKYESRAAMLAGGALHADLPNLGANYTVELWLWNGLVPGSRAIAGTVFGRGGDVLQLSGSGAAEPGRLQIADALGATGLGRFRWHHVALVRADDHATVYVDGAPDLETALPRSTAAALQIGAAPGSPSFEGRIDEVAIYPRALTADEIAEHVAAAGAQQ